MMALEFLFALLAGSRPAATPGRPPSANPTTCELNNAPYPATNRNQVISEGAPNRLGGPQ